MATTAQVYTYKGKDKRGKPIQGELKASSAVMVKAQLRKQGIAASRVKKNPSNPRILRFLPASWPP